MNSINELCFSCMNKKTQSEICPVCGFSNRLYVAPRHHLKPGTILSGKYILGKSIGEGGFGITYIGYDINLEIRVAIKEYFPNGFVSRDVQNTDAVTVFSGSSKDTFENGKNKFIKEARAIAKFDNMPGIVSVKDFFFENETAYIIMEYINGITLRQFLKDNGNRSSPETIFKMLRPLIESLSKMHKQGIIHRDISPDNIMIDKYDNVKLIDFGAARDISADGQKSLSIQLKRGYAPEEQYRAQGNQGPWTDVYALCATMYRAITGIQPVESLERSKNDTLEPPSRFGIAIDPDQESAIMQGMAVCADQRIQNMDALYNILYNSQTAQKRRPVPPNPPTPPKPSTPTHSKNLLLIILIVTCAVLALCAIIGLIAVTGLSSDEDLEDSPNSESQQTLDIRQTEAPTETEVPAPVMVSAEASSTRGTDSEGGTYSGVSTQRRGTMESIPEDIRSYMNGKSMKTNSNISFDDLCYLTIPHYDFNGNIVQGHMVVNAALGEEVLDIFAELFDIKYPIERMELVDKYGADDYTSIEANNTSAFNYRDSTDGSSRLSKHALGCAIDINPQINPYVNSNGKGSHNNAEEYWSRDYQNWSSPVARAAYIGPEAEIYRIFVNEHGWEWGGSWSSYRDYQHFQKSV